MDPQCLIVYYARKKWHDHIRFICNEILKVRSNDGTILFWRAFSLILQGNYSEALQDLETLRHKRDIEFAVVLALLYAHKQCKLVDHEEVAKIEMNLRNIEEKSGDSSVLLGATFLWLVHNHIEARRLIEERRKSVDSGETRSPMYLRFSVLLGWIDLTIQPKTPREQEIQNKSIRFFLRENQSNDFEMMLGKAKYYELKKDYGEARNLIDQIIVHHPWFQPAFAEKGMLLLKSGSWDQCIETVQRAISHNVNDIDALRLLVLHLLSRQGNHTEAVKVMRNLRDALYRTENSNADLYFEIAKCNARIADRNKAVLGINLELIDHSIKLRSNYGPYLSERAYELRLMGDYMASMECYKETLRVDESNEAALHGLIYCQIMIGQLDDADQQMEFLNVIQESIGANAELVYLQALLAWKKKGDQIGQMKLLDRAVQLHMDSLKSVIQKPDASTYNLMIALNPEFLNEVAKEYLQHISSDGSDKEKVSSMAFSKGSGILEKLLKKAPGLIGSQIIFANAQFLVLDTESAAKSVNTVLNMDSRNADAHLLMARIDLRRQHYNAALSSLEEAVSSNFSIRQLPIFHLVKAMILKSTGELEEAAKILEAAMNLPGVRPSNKKSTRDAAISLEDRASVYLCLSEVYTELKRIPEAQAIVREAMEVFRNSVEEVRVLVTNSQIAVQCGDYDSAIRMLSSVSKDSPAYSRVQVVKSEIYLNHRRDKKLFAKCYEDLVKMNPTSASYIHLGEAYLKIGQLESANKAFTTALELNPKDYELACKIGKTLVSMHDYHRAVEYYETALQTAPDRISLRLDLIELYVKLKKYDQALNILESTSALPSGSQDIDGMIHSVQMTILTASVFQGKEEFVKFIETLLKAQNAQQKVIARIRRDDVELLKDQTHQLVKICYRIAKYYEEMKNDEEAIRYYNVGLNADDQHQETIETLAKLHERRGEHDACKKLCQTLLKQSPSHEDAAIMVANMMFDNSDQEQAILNFQKLLEDKPNNFVILSKFIALLRRSGELEKSLEYFKLVDPQSMHSPGFHYCKGLFYRYQNKPHEALQELNLARRDGQWGEDAIVNMVEIYLNPDNEKIWDESNSENNLSDTIRAAQKLLDEIPEGKKSQRVQVLKAYAIMATKEKTQVEKALAIFCNILETNRDYVPALLGLATAYVLQKQVPKARNQLKRIVKMPYLPEHADEFEKSYLLLADIYVERGKYDMAQELCKNCLQHNKSNGQVWELLGLIMEKEQSYQDAGDFYQKAWKYEGEASAAIGFKLAFNLLKSHRYVDAIDVCNKVLADYPEYPKIKKEILERAQSSLRP